MKKDNNELLFKYYINPTKNINFSNMSGDELLDFIILIDDYYLKLRKKLGFDNNITFGLELEFENAMKKRIEHQLKKLFSYGEWTITGDSSLMKGAEINSPVLGDTETNWQNLNEVCSIVKPHASVGNNSGGHIHIGTPTLGDKRESWLNLIKLWSVYENIIYRFLYGNFLTARPSMLQYAKPVSKKFLDFYKKLTKEQASLEYIIKTLSYEDYQAINFCNVSYNNCTNFAYKNTIEFRCPNGSLDAVIWQNNVNFLVKMLCYCKSRSYNDDIVQERCELNLNKYDNLKWYDEIYLEQALELCDMIFSNNFDKVYFLRQYLKSFQTSRIMEKYPKAKKITKKIRGL